MYLNQIAAMLGQQGADSAAGSQTEQPVSTPSDVVTSSCSDEPSPNTPVDHGEQQQQHDQQAAVSSESASSPAKVGAIGEMPSMTPPSDAPVVPEVPNPVDVSRLISDFFPGSGSNASAAL
ncbi:unnamed protein product [Gongylonema pulchrum]|uniref:Uncharacterized protein n=1 Tax=Gongylonema pulchrum TaxID=637853 RepID=A0A183EDA0_9BILA|nr:unnamed protein product [Gongylonema pulchrum]